MEHYYQIDHRSFLRDYDSAGIDQERRLVSVTSMYSPVDNIHLEPPANDWLEMTAHPLILILIFFPLLFPLLFYSLFSSFYFFFIKTLLWWLNVSVTSRIPRRAASGQFDRLWHISLMSPQKDDSTTQCWDYIKLIKMLNSIVNGV